MLVTDIQHAQTVFGKVEKNESIEPHDVLDAVRTGFQFEENRFGLSGLQLFETVWGGYSSLIVPFNTDESFANTRSECLAFASQFTSPTSSTMYPIISVRVFWNCVQATLAAHGQTVNTESMVNQMLLTNNTLPDNVFKFVIRTQIGLVMFHFTRMINTYFVDAMEQNKSQSDALRFGNSVLTALGKNDLKIVVPDTNFFRTQTRENISFFTGVPIGSPEFESLFRLVQTDSLTQNAVQTILLKAKTDLALLSGSDVVFSEICAHYLASMAVVTTQYLRHIQPSDESSFGRRKSAKKGRNVRTGRR